MKTKYNKYDNKFIKPQHQHKSLIHVLEDVVLAMESQGMTEQDIFSLVNMILRGFVREGELTPEYIQLANQAIEMRKQAEEPQVGIVGLNGETISARQR